MVTRVKIFLMQHRDYLKSTTCITLVMVLGLCDWKVRSSLNLVVVCWSCCERNAQTRSVLPCSSWRNSWSVEWWRSCVDALGCAEEGFRTQHQRGSETVSYLLKHRALTEVSLTRHQTKHWHRLRLEKEDTDDVIRTCLFAFPQIWASIVFWQMQSFLSHVWYHSLCSLWVGVLACHF